MKKKQQTDWNQQWKMEMESSTWWKAGGDDWSEESAKRFYQWIIRPESVKRHAKMVGRLDIRPQDTVLDIGSGPGTYAIPLARVCKKVIAIDPSKAMLCYLQRYAAEEGLTNIIPMEGNWEDIQPFKDVGEHDIVIASHSLSMLDMKAALKKMNQLARRTAYLFTGAGRRREDHDDLWKKLHGEAYQHGPDYICIYNILYDMGILANVEIFDSEYRFSYKDMDEALKRWKKNCQVTDKAWEKILKEYLQRNLKKEEGRLWMIEKQKEVMIWWDCAAHSKV